MWIDWSPSHYNGTAYHGRAYGTVGRGRISSGRSRGSTVKPYEYLWRIHYVMTEGLGQVPRVSPFSPLARAVMDAFGEGVVVFDHDGRVMFANARGRAVLDSVEADEPGDSEHVLPMLARLGGRIAPLRAGSLSLGEAVYIPNEEGPKSLADRERRAIVNTLNQTEWKLAETARVLGISRTTLWRRLKAYGLHRDKRGRWANRQPA
jgi:Bacterial regulatory protein, Fis family